MPLGSHDGASCLVKTSYCKLLADADLQQLVEICQMLVKPNVMAHWARLGT